jgi:hypothetical protein
MLVERNAGVQRRRDARCKMLRGGQTASSILQCAPSQRPGHTTRPRSATSSHSSPTEAVPVQSAPWRLIEPNHRPPLRSSLCFFTIGLPRPCGPRCGRGTGSNTCSLMSQSMRLLTPCSQSCALAESHVLRSDELCNDGRLSCLYPCGDRLIVSS